MSGVGSGLVLPARPPGFISSGSLWVADATQMARITGALAARRVGNLWNQLGVYGHEERAGESYGYEGMGYGGTLVSEKGGTPFINGANATDPIWVVPHQQPRITVWLVEEEPGGGPEHNPEETLRKGEVAERIQADLMAVPVPTLTLIPKRRINSKGSDSNAIIWCPSTDELWELHRFSYFKKGALAGQPKCGYGVYIGKASQWNGVCVEGEGELSASGLSHASGDITALDLLKVARGEGIDHAIGLTLQVVLNEHVAPAIHNDHQLNTYQYLPDGVTHNPAYWTEGPEGPGSFDGIPEGTRYAYPPTSSAAEYPELTRPLEQQIYEAGRKHGFIVTDHSGIPTINIADPLTLYTPYHQTPAVNAYGSIYTAYANGEQSGERRIPKHLQEAWTDPTISPLTGNLNGTTGILQNQPWRSLQLLEPIPG